MSSSAAQVAVETDTDRAPAGRRPPVRAAPISAITPTTGDDRARTRRRRLDPARRPPRLGAPGADRRRLPRRARDLDPAASQGTTGLTRAPGRPPVARGRPDRALPRAAAPRAGGRRGSRNAVVPRVPGRRRRGRRAGRRADGTRPPADLGHPGGLVPGPRTGRARRRDRPSCAGPRRDAGEDHRPRHDEPLGELLAARATCPSAGASSSRRRRRSTRSRPTRSATCGCSGMGPRSSRCSRRASPITRRGADGCGATPPSCTRRSTDRQTSRREPANAARPRGRVRRSAGRTWTNVPRFRRPAREPFRCAQASQHCPRFAYIAPIARGSP